ncbi:Uncharacterised protein [Burkholderia pseudomallei]|nr:Uncharacterised protein [Burkholderia pseudomallei]
MQPATSLPQRSGWSLQPPRLPILTLDEQKLSPSMGYVFNKRWLDPCESLVSILWKFEKVRASVSETRAENARTIRCG